MGHEEKKDRFSMFNTSGVGHRPYMDQAWFLYLPFWIFIIAAIIVLIIMIFNEPTAGGILAYIVFAIIWGLIIWWLCDLGQLAWAWFFLLLPLIITILIAIIAAGVTAGVLASKPFEGRAVAWFRERFANFGFNM